MSPIAVADSLSNREEHVAGLARLIGKGHKRIVFEEVYRGQKQTKTVTEIAKVVNLTETQVLKSGVELVAAHAIAQTSVRGRVAYSKIASHKAIKDKVLKIAGDRKKIEAIPTKRSLNQVLVIQSPPRSKNSTARRATRVRAAKCRVAFLLASPVGAGGLNVGMDFREASDAVQRSENRNKMELRPFLAAHAGTLLDALNEFKPDIVQFSGHGGDESILVDKVEVKTSGGMVLNYNVFSEMLASAEKTPNLIVLAACETTDGAEKLLNVVPFVIAMSDTISDWAGAFFSRRLYAALVSGASIDTAVRQARSFLAAEQLPEADLPALLSAPGVDASMVRFV